MGGQDSRLSRKSAYTVDPKDLTIIGLDTDHKRGEHPLWDERLALPVSEAMVANIMTHGVIKAITAMKDGDDFLVIDGRQRVKAAREADQRLRSQGSVGVKVPLILRTGDEKRLMGVMVSANEISSKDARKLKAEKASRMLDLGASYEEIGEAFGVSVQTIRAWTNELMGKKRVRKQGGRPGRRFLTKLNAATASLKELDTEDNAAVIQAIRWAMGDLPLDDADLVSDLILTVQGFDSKARKATTTSKE